MKKVILILLIFAIFLAGCTNNQQNNNQPSENEDKICPAVCIPMWELKQVQCIKAPCYPVCEYVECGSGCGPDNVKTFSTMRECDSKIIKEDIFDEEIKSPQIKEFIVEGDDLGIYPAISTVNKGDKVKMTFKVRTEKVYYNGLDFRSNVFDTGTILPGNEKTVEFTAEETFTYTSYWPASGVEKAVGKIIVN